MIEADLQTFFSKYNSIKKIIGNFELKDSLGKKSIPFNCFEEQQIPSLLAAEIDGFRWKWSDADYRLKPFDYSSTAPAPGWVVLKFYFPKTVYVIPVKEFVALEKKSERKSITQEEAEELAEYIIDL